MTEFSKSERRGLIQMQARDVQHPDADLLSGFAEQALTSREREQVMSHLAMCSSCREVVAFAAPPVSAKVPVVQPAAKTSLWKWPVLRWGSAAAVAAVVIAAIGVSNYMKHQPVQNVSSTERAQVARVMPPESATGENKVSADTVGGVSGMQKQKVRYEKVPAVETPPQVASIPKVALEAKADAKVQRYISPPAFVQEGRSFDAVAGSGSNELAGRIPIPSSPFSDMMRAQAEQEAQMQKDLDLMAQADIAPPTSPFSARANAEASASGASREAAPSATATNAPLTRKRMMAGGSQLSSGFVAQKSVAPHPLPGSQWRVANGTLQNSANDGQNWMLVLPQYRFTTVQNVGHQVWAAGPNGMLLHSVDSGITWRRVVPRSDVAAMKGDVVSLEMSDAQNATVKTSTGETWTTTDGGNTWTKQ